GAFTARSVSSATSIGQGFRSRRAPIRSRQSNDRRPQPGDGMDDFVPADLNLDLHQLDELLGATRSRYHRRLTPFAASEQLIVIDREIREARVQPPSPELQLEIRKLTARLRALDPH